MQPSHSCEGCFFIGPAKDNGLIDSECRKIREPEFR